MPQLRVDWNAKITELLRLIVSPPPLPSTTLPLHSPAPPPRQQKHSSLTWRSKLGNYLLDKQKQDDKSSHINQSAFLFLLHTHLPPYRCHGLIYWDCD